MTKRFIPVLAACLFLMWARRKAATSLAFPPPDTKGGKPLMQTLSGRALKPLVHRQAAFRQTARRFALGRVRREPPQRKTDHPHGPEPAGS